MIQPTLGSPTDLSNCDREPIHIPGRILAHGVLLAVDRERRVILQVSDNVLPFWGVAPDALIGANIATIFGAAALAAIEPYFAPTTVERSAMHAFCGEILQRGSFDVIVHVDGPLLVIEAETATSNADGSPDFYSFASKTLARLGHAKSNLEYCDLLAAAIRDLTGYDRVMIYRFADDWSGEVYVESMTDDIGLEPFLGLHYPASDIPAQARQLFLKNGVRMLPDAEMEQASLVPVINPLTHQPLDLSHAFLRGASQMYTEYLTNMGVRASLTLALTDRETLWGLVACHHYRATRRISHGQRVVCDLLARVGSLQLTERSRADEALYRQRIQLVHSGLVSGLGASDDFGKAMLHAGGALRTLVDCSGVAVVVAGSVDLIGETPPREHVERLASVITTNTKTNVFASNRIDDFYDDARAIAYVSAGVLAVPLSTMPGEMILWFRPPLLRTVAWAGDPHKPVTVGPMGDRLTPRKSFALWTETVEHECMPWLRVEIEAAERLRTSFIELRARRNAALESLNLELARSNAELEAFAYSASHDLKEPLRGVYNHATFLLRDAQSHLAAPEIARVESIIRLANRTRELIDTLLHFSRLGRQDLERRPIAVNEILNLAIDSLATQIVERRADITVAGNLPTIESAPHLLTQIFANLLSNALKYNEAPTPMIEVGLARAGDAQFPIEARGFGCAFYVKDNGIGIAARHREAVFQIFKRLHAPDRFGGGTGAGLTIVRKAVERLGGKVWIGEDHGATTGTIVWFVLADA